MADDTDPFAAVDASVGKKTTASIAAAQPHAADPFNEIDKQAVGPVNGSSLPGSIIRGAIGGAAPAIGALPAAAAGAEVGAAAGELLFPWGGGLVGGVAGGIYGAYKGSEGIATAQNWLLNKVPRLRDLLGQSEEQKRLDEEEHPIGSFLGGIAPFAVTMSPGAVARNLPENATTWQRLTANPYTARLFSGGIMGGMQLGQEAASEDKINWNRVAIATGFGMIFNKPNRIGEAVSEYGGKPARFILGPTLAQVSEQNVAGPGVTESVFQGSEQRNPAAEAAAQHTAGVEESVIGPIRSPDVEATARRMEPDLFNEYDSLVARRAAFKQWIDESNEPKPFQLLELEEKRANLEKELADHVADRNGYTGGARARALRAQIREVEGEHSALTERAAAFKAGTAVETPDIAQARQHLMATDVALRDLQQRIQAAYRAAADYAGTPTVAPPAEEAVPEPPKPPEAQAVLQAAARPSGPLAEQKDFIAKDIAAKMVAAGRPPEEAELAGQLVAARYAARAGRFGGALGSALDLYKAEGPRIVAGRLVTKPAPPVPAAPEVPAEIPKTRQELAAYLTAHPEVQVAAAPPAPVPGAKAVKEARKISLVEYLAGRGGLSRDMLHIFGGRNVPVPGAGSLFRDNGMSADRALAAAIEGGYIHDEGIQAGRPPEKLPEDLFKLLEAEASGKKQYRLGEAPPTKAIDIGEERYRMEEAEAAKLEGEQYVEMPQEKDPLAHLSDEDIEGFFQAHAGSIRFTEGNRPIITMLKEADASTIIHELGHGWLEELMRDSQHPAAPQSVRLDAAQVVRWLGLKNIEDVSAKTKKGAPTAVARKAHERFATGFEQYLREGVAPSPELANVFARFKSWLLDIYTTIKGLGKEISPEIRQVFDRMLTEDPQATVIAEQRPGGPTITDIHEADAKLTDPHEGEQALDRVVAERDRYAEEQKPEVKAEIERATVTTEGAEPPGQGAAGGGGLREVERPGGGPEPVTPGERVREEYGKVVEGGTDARPESSALPGAGQRAGGPAEREHPLAPGAAPDTLPRGESKDVDLAGNIRVENLTSIDDVAKAIHESAERNDDFQAVRGDPMTKGMMWDLAGDLGINPAQMDDAALQSHLERLLGGMRDMAPKVLAARRLEKQSATLVSDLMKRTALSGSDEDAAELAQAIVRHDMITNALSGGTASWGRAGTAFHDISEDWTGKNIDAILKANTGRTLFQIKQIAKLGAELDTTGKISQFIRDSGRKSFGRMLVEYWVNGLISGLQTHVTYSVGNTILAMEKMGPETAAAAMIGGLRRALGREGETVRLGEVAAGLRGVREGFWPAVELALKSARTGVTGLLPGEEPGKQFLPPLSQGTELVKAAVLNEAATFQDVVGQVYGIMRGLRDGIIAGAALQRAGGVPGAPLFGWEYSPLGAIPNFQYRGVTTIPVGELVRAPSRMIAAIHSFFRPLNYSIEINQQAYRAAANENLSGTNFDSRVAELRQSPTPEMMEAGHKAGTDLTLMGAGGQFTKKLSALVNVEFFGTKDPATGKPIPGTGMPILKFIDPFIHISSNIINQSIVQRTPLGILSNTVRADLMGRNGTIAADTAAARMLAGTALSLVFGGLAAEGYVTGSEPSNPQDAAIWRQVYQAHSVRIGDVWYDMHRLGPMGMLLSTAADLYDVAHNAEQGEFSKAAATLQHAISQNILDESFMRGPSDLIKATEDPTRYGEAYVKNFVSSFIPFSVAMSQMARASDPYSRDARTVVDAIKSKVPGLSMTLMPRRDVWGEVIPSRESLGPPGLTAIWEQAVNDDPVNKAMMQLGLHVAHPERKIRNVELTPEQYDDWARLSGRLAKLRLDMIVRSSSFQNMPDYVKHDLIVEQLRQSRETARNMLFMKYPSILVDAQAAKMAKRMGQQ